MRDMNSKGYRDVPFDGDWGIKEELQRAYRFAEILVKNVYFLPSQPASILDVGCATGETANLLSIYFPFTEVYGCDFSEKAIEKCKQRFPHVQSNFFVADILDLSNKAKMKFDLVICSRLFDCLDDPEKALEELIRVSRRFVLVMVPSGHKSSKRSKYYLGEKFFVQKGFSVHKDLTTDVSTDGIQLVAILDKKYPLEPLPQDCRILIASPVRQKPDILREFLASLLSLDTHKLQVDFLFIDNNDNEASSKLLLDFKDRNPATVIQRVGALGYYERDGNTHIWKEPSIWRVAALKNMIISSALSGGYDYLFLIDSDLVLHPFTLKRLLERGKDIISNVFWTRWYTHSPPLPQVWFMDHYTIYRQLRGEGEISVQDKENRLKDVIYSLLLHPGTYEVGGLGACTLLSKKALEKGIRFVPLYNISFMGEDRHFCIRAVSAGFRLFVDTYYPAFHIYRDDDLVKIERFKLLCEESIKSGVPVDGLRLFQLIETPVTDLIFQEGEKLVEQSRVEEAIECFGRILNIDKFHAPTHNALSFIYWQRKDVEKALYHIERALELNPDDRDIIWNCGQIMIGLGRVEDAYDVYKRYLEKHPEEEEIRRVIEEIENIGKSQGEL